MASTPATEVRSIATAVIATAYLRAGHTNVVLSAQLNGGQEVGSVFNNPSNFYVNVHNPEYPGGAIRGQLDRH